MVLLRLPGSPAPDPADLIWEGEGGVGSSESSQYVVGEALVDPDGAYAIPNVPPGRYLLDVYVNTVLGTVVGNEARLQERRELRVD